MDQGYQFCYPRNQEKDQRSVGLAEGCQGGTEQTQGSRPNHAAANVFQPAQCGSVFSAAKINNLKEYSELCQYLLDHNIHDLETLETHVGDLRTTTDSLKKKLDAQTAEMKMLRKIPEYYETHKQLKPVFDGLQKIKFTKAREKYKAEHAHDLKRFYEARRIISQKFPDGKFDRKVLEAEYAELERQHDATYSEFKAIRAESH